MEQKTMSQKVGGAIMMAAAVLMALYHLFSAQYPLVEPAANNVIHVGFALVIVFGGLAGTSKGLTSLLAFLSIIASIVVTVYLLIEFDPIQRRALFPTDADVVIGLIALAVVIFSSTLAFGLTLPIVVCVIAAYTMFGHYLPPPFETPDLLIRDQIIPYFSTGLGTGWGIYGEVVAISANYIFLLILFGSILEAVGGVRFIAGIGTYVGAKLASGPAAVAIIGDIFLGMVTGSTVASITLTGSFTIPMMKKVGYTPEQAAAIEAASSNGGQIMPPVMGTVAFVMAGFTGIPYYKICIASIIPALIYYMVLLLYAELQARKLKISRERMELMDRREMLLDAPIFLVPLGILTVLLFMGRSLMNLAFWAIVSSLVVSLIRAKTRPSFSTIMTGLARGAKAGAEVAVSTALIGIIVTCFSVSGLGIKLPMIVETISGGILPIALFLVMIVSLLLGTGVPTIVAYILVAVIAVPIIMRMGVPQLQAHYFAMWFAVSAHLTPPVAIGAMVAAGMAGAKFWGTCMEAMKAAAGTFIIPWLIIYAPVLILRPDNFLSGLTGMVSCILGFIGLQFVFSNYLFHVFNFKESAGFLAAAVVLFAAIFLKQPVLLPVGMVIFALAFIYHWTRHKTYIAAAALQKG